MLGEETGVAVGLGHGALQYGLALSRPRLSAHERQKATGFGSHTIKVSDRKPSSAFENRKPLKAGG
jgi:hypothetical protein